MDFQIKVIFVVIQKKKKINYGNFFKTKNQFLPFRKFLYLLTYLLMLILYKIIEWA